MGINNKVLFFDIGGVLLSNGWGHESREKAAKEFGFDYHEMNSLHEFIFNVYEIGRMSLDQYLDFTVFHQPRSFTREDFRAFIFAQSVELPGTLQWLKDWKQNQSHKVKIISINNEGKELNDYRVKKFRLYECFDAFISSCEVGMRKPDPGIFKLALGIGQVNLEDCLYFDDRPLLAEAAQRIGINAYRHISFEATKEIILKFTGKIE